MNKIQWIQPKLTPAREMPGLVHWVGKNDGQPFDVQKSEVVRWLASNGSVMVWLVDKLRRSGMIRYDASNNMWIGVPKSEALPVSNIADAEDFESGQPGRPMKHKADVLLACFTNEQSEIVGLSGWYRRMRHLCVSEKTFKRMVDRLVASGKVVRAAGQIHSAPGRFPNMAVYRLAKPAENIPTSIPSEAAPASPESPPRPPNVPQRTLPDESRETFL